LCNADGSQPEPLTSFGGPKVAWPKWSPDGKQIAFYSEIDGNSEIYVLNVKQRKHQRLTTHPAWDGNLQWSRDGKGIYFVSRRGPTQRVFKIAADGSGEPVPMDERFGSAPIESPDGKYFYFLRGTSAWRVPVGGGEAVPIVEELRPQGGLEVFRDGIYYVGTLGEDGTHPIQFKDFASGQVETLARTTGPAWWNLTLSPDRRKLLYVQIDQAGSDLMLVENFR
jgi:Tol biopolymer transport system component